MEKGNYYVYIVTNFTNTTLYIGVTNNLERRILTHKIALNEGFTKKYHLTKLVFFEVYSRVEDAIEREKQLKRWHRSWKLNLIKDKNPLLQDLFEK